MTCDLRVYLAQTQTIPIVSGADAVVEPFAVMIKVHHTLIALSTVLARLVSAVEVDVRV